LNFSFAENDELGGGQPIPKPAAIKTTKPEDMMKKLGIKKI